MKNTELCAVSTSAIILAILLAVNGNVYAAEHHEDYEEHDTTEDYTAHEHKSHGKYAGKIVISMYFDKKPSYYGDAMISTNGVEKIWDFGSDAEKFGSPILIPYYYKGYKPHESVVCLENLESGRQNCVEVYSNEKKVDINMPD